MSETKKYYTIGDCVRVRRVDDTNSEHDEFVADARNWKHAQEIADALNNLEAQWNGYYTCLANSPS